MVGRSEGVESETIVGKLSKKRIFQSYSKNYVLAVNSDFTIVLQTLIYIGYSNISEKKCPVN